MTKIYAQDKLWEFAIQQSWTIHAEIRRSHLPRSRTVDRRHGREVQPIFGTLSHAIRPKFAKAEKSPQIPGVELDMEKYQMRPIAKQKYGARPANR